MTVELHKDDLPPGGHFGQAVAIDTETLGLNPYRDRLCLVQLSRGDGNAELVQFRRHYEAPELRRLLADESVLKIFHFARFDMAVLNDVDRFHLVADVVDRVPAAAPHAAHVKQWVRDRLVDHRQHVNEHGEDMPEILNWRWTDDFSEYDQPPPSAHVEQTSFTDA